jgi:NitT/TauT family transport system ATP-binding protein
MLNDLDLNKKNPEMAGKRELVAKESIIEVAGVSKVYPREPKPALHDISFSVRESEFLTIVGASGCGKSTLLRLIAGLEKPSTGTIKSPKGIGMVFQSGALFPWLTALQNVALPLEAAGIDRLKASKEALTFLRMVSLEELAGRRPTDLSGGQRQRVGIARALAIKPAVLLLDEPFSALDPKTTAELHEDVLRIWRETKKTIVMVSHLIEEAVSLADRVILMRDGGIEKIFPITLPYPRREQALGFSHDVLEIRREFFK